MNAHLYLSDAWLENKHQKDICVDEIGLRAQNLLFIVDPINNLIGKMGYIVSSIFLAVTFENSYHFRNVFVTELVFSIHIHKPTKVFICESKFNYYNWSLIQEQHEYHNSSQFFIHRSTISFKISILELSFNSSWVW